MSTAEKHGGGAGEDSILALSTEGRERRLIVPALTPDGTCTPVAGLLLTVIWTHDNSPPDYQEEMVVDEQSTDVMPGTLDMLILKTLSLAPMHGFGIARRG